VSGLDDVRRRLTETEGAVARALSDLRGQVASLGPSDAEILHAEVAALRRTATATPWAPEVERVRELVRDVRDGARRLEHRRSAARRAAWSERAPALGVANAVPDPIADAGSTGSKLLRHGWLAGLTIGVLMAGDGLATLVWQDPLSALHARQAQDRLDRQLPSLIGEFDALGRDRAPDFPADARRLEARVAPGHALGRIEIPEIGASFDVVQGTSASNLEAGPGHYAGTSLPGEGGTVGVAGHRTTYLAPFRGLDRLAHGDRVVLQMPYGRFTYRVTRHARVNPSSSGVLRSATSGERLVLTTCDPVFSDARRLVVFAKLVDARR
jgi:sortase A